MPKGEDPDSMLRGGDVSGFAQVIESAVPIPDFRINLIVSRHNMSSDEGKTAALKEIVGVLAEIDSLVERERLIRHLTKYHPNFSSGTTHAEDHLRGEVSRVRARLPKKGMARSIDKTKETSTQEQKPLVKVSPIERWERLLLGIIILRNGNASKVFATLPPKEFTGESSRLLAEAVSRLYSDTGKIEQERLRSEVAGTPAEKLLLDLIMAMDESEMNHPIDELIRVIVNHNERRRRIKELADKIMAGKIKSGDPEYAEWIQLKRETSNPWNR